MSVALDLYEGKEGGGVGGRRTFCRNSSGVRSANWFRAKPMLLDDGIITNNHMTTRTHHVSSAYTDSPVPVLPGELIHQYHVAGKHSLPLFPFLRRCINLPFLITPLLEAHGQSYLDGQQHQQQRDDRSHCFRITSPTSPRDEGVVW